MRDSTLRHGIGGWTNVAPGVFMAPPPSNGEVRTLVFRDDPPPSDMDRPAESDGEDEDRTR